MGKAKLEQLIQELQQYYSTQNGGLGVITRTELACRSGGLFKRKTLANLDSKGKGIRNGFHDKKSGQQIYYIDDVVIFLRARF